MTTLQTKPLFVSTFLSHSSADSELVEAVAKRLRRRGILTWLDKNELLEMGPLDTVLKQAVQQQATLTIFLSEAYLKSEWCKDELRWAIEAQEGTQHILPVYLGNPLQLVKSHDLLQSRFLDADANRVNQLGYVCQQNSTGIDPDAIAEKIAVTAYRRSIPNSWSDVVIVLDQRGNGPRRGEPDLPDHIVRLNAPALTFRPSLQPRQKAELLTGEDWEDMAKTVSSAFYSIPGDLRNGTRRIRILGGAQTGLFWAVGNHFDRTTRVELYSYDWKGEVMTNKEQGDLTPLTGGDPNCARLITDDENNSTNTQGEAALYVGSDGYLQDVQEDIGHLPLYWIETKTILSEQAMPLVADIIASIKRLYQEEGVRRLALYWGTASSVALLTAANLTTHSLPKIKYMERDRAQAKYIHLPMPEDS
ncbi:toll/interleukin-1 receptor domain-containing protein [Nodosilinea sp. LEGE 07088]|uniref:toll/interleukin-1 receptor domain-containing protein n=1 Tax=Nodosilinea sp. LEGE 07088 TaxID=2777968 RepID=UPI00187F37FD|nr:toll/interleukin-1 receptor domain-containing protein [Nodosilinea sp. LEGE 07088]MBE9138833.1 toll/interleukin-1 receptor domain-containing protein [Nodosilinea sp. LEGE 07088]